MDPITILGVLGGVLLVGLLFKVFWTPSVSSIAAFAKLKPGSKVKVRGKISSQSPQPDGKIVVQAVQQFRGKWVPVEQKRSRLVIELSDGTLSLENDGYEVSAKDPPVTSSSLQQQWSNGHHTASLVIHSQGKQQVANWDSSTGQGTHRRVEISVDEPVLVVGKVAGSPGSSQLTAIKVESQRLWQWEN